MQKIARIIKIEQELVSSVDDLELLLKAKERGFSDIAIARIWNMDEKADLRPAPSKSYPTCLQNG